MRDKHHQVELRSRLHRRRLSLDVVKYVRILWGDVGESLCLFSPVIKFNHKGCGFVQEFQTEVRRTGILTVPGNG